MAMVLHLLSTIACLWFTHAVDESHSTPISFEAAEDDPDDKCTLLPGQCDDDSKPGFTSVARNQTKLDMDLEHAYSKVGGTFYCYTTGAGKFLAYDPPAPDTSKLRNKLLPKTIKDLQEDWMASDFEYGQPCKAFGPSYKDCPKGFTVDHAGMAVANDAGDQYGGGTPPSQSAPPKCGGCQEEVVVCLSSARSVRYDCEAKPLTPPSSSAIGRQERFLMAKNLTGPHANSCPNTKKWKNSWVLRNRNQWSHNNALGYTSHGTGKYFYLVTMQGFPCRAQRDATMIKTMILRYAQGFQAAIDLWRIKPACNGKCMFMSGALSAWMTYSVPVAVSILTQLRAWSTLKVDGIKGCDGEQAVLKFGSVSVSDGGVPCCPEPFSGGRCNQNYKLPEGWQKHITDDSEADFATWVANKLGNGVGACDGSKDPNAMCDTGAPGDTAGMCPDAEFGWNSKTCKPYSFKNYIPKGAVIPTTTPAPGPAPATTAAPAPGDSGSNTIYYIIAAVAVLVLLCGIIVLFAKRKQTAVASVDGSSMHPIPGTQSS